MGGRRWRPSSRAAAATFQIPSNKVRKVLFLSLTRVARWFVFNPKIQIWVNSEHLAMEDVGIHILWPFGIFYSNLVYFMAIWYIFWLFGIFFPVLVCCSKKNLATLSLTRIKDRLPKKRDLFFWQILATGDETVLVCFDNNFHDQIVQIFALVPLLKFGSLITKVAK
jgi:hypothetical protein